MMLPALPIATADAVALFIATAIALARRGGTVVLAAGLAGGAEHTWAQALARTPAAAGEPAATASASDWKVGGFLDVGFVNSLNSPSNHLFRSRGTTPRVDELTVNMAGGYIRRTASEDSRWGLELTAHVGEDSKLFAFSATAANVSGASWLRHLGPTNVSYLAPLGRGLNLQGGIFSSFVGYDSLYTKDNFTYTRPWTADFTPYLMLGASAGYPLGDNLTLTGLLVNGYWHLAHANNVPSIGGQVAYRRTGGITLKQTVLYGPHQPDTALTRWRFLSDSIVERKTQRMTAALEFQASTEVVDAIGTPRAWWVAAQAPLHWAVKGPWSMTVRPELAWDSKGRWTTFEQSVRALAITVEYRAAFGQSQSVLRFEHRYDHSTGAGGGFFRDIEPGAVGLTPGQHLLIVGWILTFDGSLQRRLRG